MRYVAVLASLLSLVFAASPVVAAAGSSTSQHPVSVPAGSDEFMPVESLVIEAPGQVEFDVRITATDETRALRISADSGTFFRSSTIDLNGRDSQRVHTFRWHGFPVGDYEVVGMLLRDDGTEEVVVRGALKVIARSRIR